MLADIVAGPLAHPGHGGPEGAIISGVVVLVMVIATIVAASVGKGKRPPDDETPQAGEDESRSRPA